MIIAGWGKNAKKIAFSGINRCPNCKNWAPTNVYELATKASLYFIPVAKFNRKYYLVCSLCQAGWELDEKAKETLLRESVTLPDEKTAVGAWNTLSTDYATLLRAAERISPGSFEGFLKAEWLKVGGEPPSDVKADAQNTMDNLKEEPGKDRRGTLMMKLLDTAAQRTRERYGQLAGDYVTLRYTMSLGDDGPQ